MVTHSCRKRGCEHWGWSLYQQITPPSCHTPSLHTNINHVPFSPALLSIRSVQGGLFVVCLFCSFCIVSRPIFVAFDALEALSTWVYKGIQTGKWPAHLFPAHSVSMIYGADYIQGAVNISTYFLWLYSYIHLLTAWNTENNSDLRYLKLKL